MNEFIEQFLVECRELVAQASDDLLVLEEAPKDSDRLDSAFRAFHTLKGAAAIVDFHAMGRALHAAEDVLSLVRAGDGQVTPQLIGDCLTCLDQVVQWLDLMASTGEVPEGAEAQADAVVSRFARTVEIAPRADEAKPTTDWLAAALARHPDHAGQARSAIRYAPDGSCFLRGEDPLATMAELPGLLALEISPKEPWPALEEMDPFACNLLLVALSSAASDQALAHFERQIDRVQVLALAPDETRNLPPEAHALIEAQALLLADPTGEPTAGRTASARAVAVNVLRSLGRSTQAERISLAAAGDLAAALRDTLIGTPVSGAIGQPPQQAAAPPEAASRALRVDVERIDSLVKLTGELTIAKNALAHAAVLARNGAPTHELAVLLKAQDEQLDRLVRTLQHAVLELRVLPLRHVFQRLPRLVREIVAALGKPARLVTEGDDTEADKAIVDNLFEPLLHVLRNALDHGVEPPEARVAAGKPPSATITLRAFREGSHVVVEIADDGAGIDVARVRAAAVERGAAAPEVLADMADEDVVNLIFAPGLSTAAVVSSLSGRGVGMDAARAAVERMGGRVSVASRPGSGATVRFTLPFTVMMTSVMTVEAGGQTFGIPLESTVETSRLSRATVAAVGAAQAFAWRGKTLPLIDLAGVLGERRARDDSAEAYVVVTTTLGQLAGLEVDRIGDRMDVMLKPLAGLLSGMRGIAGSALLGDGRVLLVLDLPTLLL